MRPCIEQSNDLAPLSLFRSWLGCITNTSGYDFRKGQERSRETPRGLSYTGDHRFQSIWTQLRTPTITLPTHGSSNGMPVGIQLVSMPYADDRLLAMARLIFGTLGRGPVIKL